MPQLPSRRTVVAAGAWSVPVLTLAVAAPASAASTAVPSVSALWSDPNASTATLTVSVSDAPAAANTIVVTLTTGSTLSNVSALGWTAMGDVYTYGGPLADGASATIDVTVATSGDRPRSVEAELAFSGDVLDTETVWFDAQLLPSWGPVARTTDQSKWFFGYSYTIGGPDVAAGDLAITFRFPAGAGSDLVPDASHGIDIQNFDDGAEFVVHATNTLTNTLGSGGYIGFVLANAARYDGSTVVAELSYSGSSVVQSSSITLSGGGDEFVGSAGWGAIGTDTVEGVDSATSVFTIANRDSVDLPADAAVLELTFDANAEVVPFTLSQDHNWMLQRSVLGDSTFTVAYRRNAAIAAGDDGIFGIALDLAFTGSHDIGWDFSVYGSSRATGTLTLA